MSLDYGTGVKRTLDAASRQFATVLWLYQKPPLSPDLTLMSQNDLEEVQKVVRTMMPSGFMLDPTRTVDDYKFDSAWTNYFQLGNPRPVTGVLGVKSQVSPLWANVNGWLIPICGTNVENDGDLFNIVKLYPAPESDTRIDLVFLEAWQCRVDANPSTVNKPSASTIWKYGNVQYGGTNFDDDIKDPTLGIASTSRIQIQYRIRVQGWGAGLGASVSLDVYPDGLGDPNTFGQGTATSPISGLIFSNMGAELGDPSLWRAGDGDSTNALGTVDGYTYAIPICAVFRRNSGTYVAVNGAGNANQNGAFERTPATKLLPDPLAGDRLLLTPSLTYALTATEGVTTDAIKELDNLNGSGLEDFGDAPASLFLTIEDEIIQVGAIDLVNNTITIPAGGRGRFGTNTSGHAAGTTLGFYNLRPDGKYADEIASTDILDLRRGVNAQEWDYRRLLEHNVAALAKGNLHSAWKKAGAGDTQGPVVHEVDYLFADGGTAVPNQTEALDGPDGIRTVFSDAAALQPNVTLLLDNDAQQDVNQMVGFTNDPLDDTVQWDVKPDFYPSAFMNVFGLAATNVWTNGSLIFLYTGGVDGTGGVRGTFRDGTTRAVRPLMPQEFWKDNANSPSTGLQTPVTMRFLDQRGLEPSPEFSGISDANAPSRHLGPMYPSQQSRFTHPYIVLGSVVRSGLKLTGIPATFTAMGGGLYELDVGVNFDAYPGYRSINPLLQVDDTSAVTNLLVRDSRTLYGMLTSGGKDFTGFNSEVYVILYGDTTSLGNNGVFRVVGAGQTTYYTTNHASNSTSVVLLPLSLSGTPSTTASTLSVEFRSQYSNADDGSSYTAKQADVVIGLTDVGGLGNDHLWTKTALGDGEDYNLSMPTDGLNPTYPAIASKLLLDMTFLYHPGRGGTARVPDEIVRFAMRDGATDTIGAYLRQSEITVDPTFPAQAEETYWDLNHIQLWNRLGGLGLQAPTAPGYGGEVVGYTEQDREHEVFYDKGSKTLLFRPFRDRQMTLRAMTFTDNASWTWSDCLLGSYTYPDTAAKDALGIWTAGKQMGYAIPCEFMPRFGRQDIPYWQRVGTNDPFLPGINHLFVDAGDLTLPVFNIIGGRDNTTGGNEVTSFFFTTSSTYANYGKSGSILGVPVIGARNTTDINPALPYASDVIAALAAVNSSDFGKGLKGIQLPPYYGPARVYGVYDLRDYISKGGSTFKANRYEMEANAAPNLLREGATNQTLFILQDGAQDLTTETDDHTYIIPSNALDITKALQYVNGDKFEDYQYVVECSVFGFTKGFINKNNYVLARLHTGAGTLVLDSAFTATTTELEGVHMVIPCPAGVNDQFYVAYNRTVYQGDPYMSRSGDSKTSSDYETRYGQIPMSDQYLVRTPIQQFDSNGNFIPQKPNPKSFELLASMDFYTTLGTGKIGGQLYPGTVLDIGYTELDAYKRMPEASNQPAWRVLTRTFTDPVSGEASKASAGLVVGNLSKLCYWTGAYLYHTIQVGLPDGNTVELWASLDGAAKATLIGLGIDAEDIWEVDADSEDKITRGSATFGPFTLNPGQVLTHDITVPVTVSTLATPVHINVRGTVNNLTVYGWMQGFSTLRVVMANTWDSPFGFAGTVGQVLDATIPGVTVAPGASVVHTVSPFDAATTGMSVVVQDLSPTTDALFFTGVVTAPGVVTVYAHNATAGAITIGVGGRNVRIALLDDVLSSAHTITINNAFDYVIFEKQGSLSVCAANLVNCINSNSKLSGKVYAYNDRSAGVHLGAYYPGSQGNEITLTMRHTAQPPEIADLLAVYIVSGEPNPYNVLGQTTTVPLIQDTFHGGSDIPPNAGNGTTQLELTGMIERFPLGVLLQDSDFLCEDPLRDTASTMNSTPSGPRPLQTSIPLTNGGDEYTRFWGESGEMIALSDGSISVVNYGAWTEATPTGTKKFRLYRGGGPVFIESGETPGGPIDWVAGTFPPSLQPVLKGGILACRAMLVRNFYEEIDPGTGAYTVSNGDEIQMVIATYGILGQGTESESGYSLQGILGTAGYGEGYAAADRYRLAGKPMFRGFGEDSPDPTVIQVAVYPDTMRT